jgi:hypothetical protein
MIYRIARRILDYPKTSLILLLAATVLAALAIPRTQFDSSIRSFIMADDKDYDLYNRYKEVFGQDDILVIAFEAEDIFAPESLALIRRLTERIEQVENVFDVRSLWNAEYMKGGEDSFEAVRIVKSADAPKEEREAGRAIATRDPLFRLDLVSDDGRKTAIIVTLRASPDPNDLHVKEIGIIEKIVGEESARTGIRLHLIGERYLDIRFLGYIKKDLTRFVPITYVLIATLLFLGFRDWRYTAISFGAILVFQTWMAAMIPLLGLKMNSVNAGLPSLILCIALTEAVHWIHGYRKERLVRPDSKEAMAATLKELVLPSFVTVITAAIGFASLATSAVRPIRDFGILAALGIVASFVVMVVMLPSLILIWKEKKTEVAVEDTELLPSRWFVALADAMLRRRRLSWTVILLLTGLSVAGVFLLRVEIDRTRYLKQSSDIYQAVDFVDRNLVGTSQLDIWIETGKADAIKDPAVLNQMDKLAAFLRAQPEMQNGGKVLSLCDFLKAMNKAFHEDKPEFYTLPETREQVAQLLLMYSMSGRKNEIDKYVDFPSSRTRLSIRTAEHKSRNLDLLIARVRAYLADPARMDPKLNARLASLVVVNLNVFHYLLNGMTQGFWTGFFLIGAVMCVAFRSIKVGLVSMIPNVIPTVASLGLIGWLGIPLEMATAMIFSIALGISVDDTIHCLARFRLEYDRCGDRKEAMRKTLARIGSSMVESTLVISAGFLVAVFASLKMNILFGVLSACVMILAMLCDLTITPLCATGFKLYRRAAAAQAGENKEAEDDRNI